MVEVSVNRNVKEAVSAERLAEALEALASKGEVDPEMYLYLEQFFELPEELIVEFLKKSKIKDPRKLLTVAFEKGFRGSVFENLLAEPV